MYKAPYLEVHLECLFWDLFDKIWELTQAIKQCGEVLGEEMELEWKILRFRLFVRRTHTCDEAQETVSRASDTPLPFEVPITVDVELERSQAHFRGEECARVLAKEEQNPRQSFAQAEGRRQYADRTTELTCSIGQLTELSTISVNNQL